MEQWEYRSQFVQEHQEVIDGPGKAWDPWLNELGRQGWELVGAVAADTDRVRYRLFFKRRVAG